MSAVRSQWEIDTVAAIRSEFPNLKIETNNRTIIRPRDNPFGNKLEIDIYIPSLKLGFELNGKPYHDQDQYYRDKFNGASLSTEMYKERFCKKRGIKLVHIWSTESKEYNLNKIFREIREAKQGPHVSSIASLKELVENNALTILMTLICLSCFIFIFYINFVVNHSMPEPWVIIAGIAISAFFIYTTFD